MNIWITTDTHINHRKMAERGWRPADYQEQVLENHAKIPQDSMLIHLGDVAMGKDAESNALLLDSIEQCFPKILVKGNHDTKSDSWYIDAGWDFVTKRFENQFFGAFILFGHKPVPPRKGIDAQIHGHTHGDTHRDEEHRAFYDPSYHLELALENTDMNPVNLQDFLRENGVID